MTSLKTKAPPILQKGNLPPHQQPGTLHPSLASASSMTTFCGPIPPPEMLKQYELLMPGIAEKFLQGPILEAEHRRALEQRVVAERIRASKVGQKMAFSLALLSISGALTAIFFGYSLAGLGTFFIAAASFAGIFIYSRKQQA